jgi:hypothetical protein
VHSRGLVGKSFGEAVAGTQTHSDLTGPPDSSEVWRLVLAIIDQAEAVTTGENPASGIHESNPTATVLDIGVRLTTKPRSPPAKGARRPRDRYALRYDRSVLASPIPRPEHQRDGVTFGEDRDSFRRLPHPGQSMQETGLCRLLARPGDEGGTLARVTVASLIARSSAYLLTRAGASFLADISEAREAAQRPTETRVPS